MGAGKKRVFVDAFPLEEQPTERCWRLASQHRKPSERSLRSAPRRAEDARAGRAGDSHAPGESRYRGCPGTGLDAVPSERNEHWQVSVQGVLHVERWSRLPSIDVSTDVAHY